MGSFEDTMSIINSDSTFNAPFGFENIITLCILDLQAKGYMGTTQDSIDLKLKIMGFSLHFFFPWHFSKSMMAISRILINFKPCGVSIVFLFHKPIAMVPLKKERFDCL